MKSLFLAAGVTLGVGLLLGAASEEKRDSLRIESDNGLHSIELKATDDGVCFNMKSPGGYATINGNDDAMSVYVSGGGKTDSVGLVHDRDGSFLIAYDKDFKVRTTVAHSGVQRFKSGGTEFLPVTPVERQAGG